MLKFPSLYEQNPPAWDALEAAGYRGAVAMSKHFHKASVMDRALGYENGVARWHRGAGKPSGEAEARCNQWLAKQSDAPAEAPPARTAPQGTLLLVACDAAAADKAKRLLSIIGCEVTEV